MQVQPDKYRDIEQNLSSELSSEFEMGNPRGISATSVLHPNSYLKKSRAFLCQVITYSFLELVFRLPLLLKPTQAPGPSCLYRQAINALALASDDATAAL